MTVTRDVFPFKPFKVWFVEIDHRGVLVVCSKNWMRRFQ